MGADGVERHKASEKPAPFPKRGTTRVVDRVGVGDHEVGYYLLVAPRVQPRRRNLRRAQHVGRACVESVELVYRHAIGPEGASR